MVILEICLLIQLMAEILHQLRLVVQICRDCCTSLRYLYNFMCRAAVLVVQIGRRWEGDVVQTDVAWLKNADRKILAEGCQFGSTPETKVYKNQWWGGELEDRLRNKLDLTMISFQGHFREVLEPGTWWETSETTHYIYIIIYYPLWQDTRDVMWQWTPWRDHMILLYMFLWRPIQAIQLTRVTAMMTASWQSCWSLPCRTCKPPMRQSSRCGSLDFSFVSFFHFAIDMDWHGFIDWFSLHFGVHWISLFRGSRPMQTYCILQHPPSCDTLDTGTCGMCWFNRTFFWVGTWFARQSFYNSFGSQSQVRSRQGLHPSDPTDR